MKKVYLLFALVAIGLTGCQKDQVGEDFVIGQEGAVLKLKLDLSGAKVATRAIEDSHLNPTVTPVVNSATLYAYNEYNVKTEIDITDAATLDKLKNGVAFEVGLPVGTKSIDIVLNKPAGKYTDYSENINYFNHKPKADVGDDWLSDTNNYVGKDNFERVFLTTDNFAKGTGLLLQGNVTPVTGASTPSFTLNETLKLKPNLSRFEVLEGITVADEAEFVDTDGLRWKQYAIGAGDALETTIEQTFKLEVSEQDIIKDAVGGFYYIPEKYKSSSSATAADTESDIYKQITSDPIKWFPNMYYAVDVEEVYVNNIKVRSPEKTPFMMPWPGASDATDNWPNWYKAYHLEGWHTAGISSNNSFLCMGNMWDRIATGTLVDVRNFNIQNVAGTGAMSMKVISGKATPVADKSEYKSTNNRNIGIKTGKAAAYMFYPQVKGSSTTTTNKDALMAELPHIILKVKCYANSAAYAAGTPEPDKNFITLKLFASSSSNPDSNYITSFERGKIYRLDLKNLVNLFKGSRPFPGAKVPNEPSTPVDKDPEMPGSQLTMQIEILNWEAADMYPVI